MKERDRRRAKPLTTQTLWTPQWPFTKEKAGILTAGVAVVLLADAAGKYGFEEHLGNDCDLAGGHTVESGVNPCIEVAGEGGPPWKTMEGSATSQVAPRNPNAARASAMAARQLKPA